MALKLGRHLFYGPFEIETVKVRANQTPVVFAVVSKTGDPWNPEFRLIETGASGDTDLVFSTHPNREAWTARPGDVQVYLFDAPRREWHDANTRKALAEQIARQFEPPNDLIPL